MHAPMTTRPPGTNTVVNHRSRWPGIVHSQLRDHEPLLAPPEKYRGLFPRGKDSRWIG
jgi:hypothetical protein